MRGTSRITRLVDKGAGKGALVYVEREIVDTASGELLATVNQTVFCRADGGFGGTAEAVPAHPMPERASDDSITLPTSPQAALIYRLSGDFNPLHLKAGLCRKRCILLIRRCRNAGILGNCKCKHRKRSNKHPCEYALHIFFRKRQCPHDPVNP